MINFKNILLLSILLTSGHLFAQSINKVSNEAKSDLQIATEDLNQLRNSITNEKIPISRKVRELEIKAKKLRTELENNLRLRDNREASLVQLEKEVKETESDLSYSLNLINNYVSSWYSRTPEAEKTLWAANLSNILDSPELTSGFDSFKSAFQGIYLSIESIQKTAGGIFFIGNATVPPEGIRDTGAFFSIGPIIFFSGKAGSSGLLERAQVGNQSQTQLLTTKSVLKSNPARIHLLSPKTSKLISEAFSSKSIGSKNVILPLDPTLGKASILEKGELNLLEELNKGGIWIYPILIFAALSIIIALIKSSQILKIKLPQSGISLETKYLEPFDTLRKTAKSYQGESPEILEEILYELIIDAQVKLEKALPLVAITAATAPLLGLLGTVTGMIDVFRQITNFANPENSELARGISEALVTTKFGLITAIPALIAHALLSRRIQGIISKMEGFSAGLVRLKQENLSNRLNDIPDESNS